MLVLITSIMMMACCEQCAGNVLGNSIDEVRHELSLLMWSPGDDVKKGVPII